MSTIFTANQYDEAKAKRRRNLVISLLLAAAILGVLGFKFRHYPYERRVDKFFQAVERKDFETAYGMWLADPQWKQHPDKYAEYRFHEFHEDWSNPEWGPVRKHEVLGSRARGTGVIVVVRVNDIVDPDKQARIWIEKDDKTFTFSPY